MPPATALDVLRDRNEPRRPRRRQPARLPRRAGRGDRRGPRRPHDRRRTLPRRDRRLAHLHPLAVRRQGARAVGDDHPDPARTALRRVRRRRLRRRGAVERRRHRHPAARGRRRAAARPGPARPRRDRAEIVAALPGTAAVRRPLPRVRGPGAAAAATPARPAHAAVAAAPAGGRPAGGGVEVPELPDPARGHPRVLQRRLRPAGPAAAAHRGPQPDASAWSRSRHPRASPFAQSLLFGWIAVYMYEGDAPLAERRAAALALDRDLLRDLLGAEELRVTARPRRSSATVELELQRLGRRARRPRRRRAARPAARARSARPRSSSRPASPTQAVRSCRRGCPSCSTRHRVLEVGDRGGAALRSGRGRGTPARRARRRHARRVCRRAFTDPVDDAAASTWSRATPAPTVRSRPPRSCAGSAPSAESVALALERARRGDGRVVQGEFRPGGVEREWCDADVLRQLRRRSLAALRNEVEPVEGAALARFLPALAGRRVQPARRRRAGRRRRGAAGRGDPGVAARGRRAAAAGAPTTAPADLDLLCTTGEVVWVGAGSVGTHDGRVRLVFRDQVPVLVPDARR